jgi:hypothetical protein
MELVATERGVRVRDLGSRNGTFLGDTRIGEVYLLKPTLLVCGDTMLEFSPSTPRAGRGPRRRRVRPARRDERGHARRLRAPAQGGADRAHGPHHRRDRHRQGARRAGHPRGERADAHKPFVVVDCGAIPATLAESALFGHERGSFTGAVDKRISPFVEADGGTIFLDELGELPVDVQPKLLRALAEQRIKSVGSNSYRPVNVRVIAATRRDLVREVNAGNFRSDLVLPRRAAQGRAPALRQRLEDIPGLVRRMMRRSRRQGAYDRITSDSLERLMRHDWPGNVRELRNVVAVALAFGKEGPLDLAQHLAPIVERDAESTPTRGRTFQDAKRDVLARFEREYFTALYAECSGNVSEIGRRAAMERAHVRGYLRRHGIGDAEGEREERQGARGQPGLAGREGCGRGTPQRGACNAGPWALRLRRGTPVSRRSAQARDAS